MQETKHTITSPATEAPPGHRALFFLAMVFVTLLVVSNTIAVKIISIGPFAIAGGIVCFPLSYLFGDILTEVYGYRQTKRIIWAGFACLALMSVFYLIATKLPPAPFYKDDEAFGRLLGFVPRIVAGSLCGYLVGSFLNAIVMSRLKVVTNGKHLWLRFVASTIAAELGDSFIFAFVAFYGVFENSQLLNVAFTGFVLKTLYEVAATPLTYIVVGLLKKYEGVDIFDRNESYSVI